MHEYKNRPKRPDEHHHSGRVGNGHKPADQLQIDPPEKEPEVTRREYLALIDYYQAQFPSLRDFFNACRKCDSQTIIDQALAISDREIGALLSQLTNSQLDIVLNKCIDRLEATTDYFDPFQKTRIPQALRVGVHNAKLPRRVYFEKPSEIYHPFFGGQLLHRPGYHQKYGFIIHDEPVPSSRAILKTLLETGGLHDSIIKLHGHLLHALPDSLIKNFLHNHSGKTLLGICAYTTLQGAPLFITIPAGLISYFSIRIKTNISKTLNKLLTFDTQVYNGNSSKIEGGTKTQQKIWKGIQLLRGFGMDQVVRTLERKYARADDYTIKRYITTVLSDFYQKHGLKNDAPSQSVKELAIARYQTEGVNRSANARIIAYEELKEAVANSQRINPTAQQLS